MCALVFGGVALSGDWSSDTVRNGLWGLDAYINMLEILLREAREARGSVPEDGVSVHRAAGRPRW